MKNYGLNVELEKAHQKPTDYALGGTGAKCVATIPLYDRAKYLPDGEVQRGAEDTMDCASRAPVNIMETKFNFLLDRMLLPISHRKFLIENGYVDERGRITFSDAYVAIKSGTTRSGNSLIAPCDAIYRHGMVPKSLLPLGPTMTFDEYHNPKRITPEIEKLGRRFKDFFMVNYEKVQATQYREALLEDMLDVGAFAWPAPINGVYPATPDWPNHAFILFEKPDFRAFDNYVDAYDGDFIKQLAQDYIFIDHGYRLILSLRSGKAPSSVERLLAAIKKIFKL